MKSTLARVYGWHNFHSGVHWQYVVCYAYSTYVNVCLRKKGGYNSRTLHSRRARTIRSWFCCSAQSQLPWLSTLLQHCCASRCSFAGANSERFRTFGAGIVSRGGCKVTGNNRNCHPRRPSEREGELCEPGQRLGERQATAQSTRIGEQRKQFIRLPHLWCVVLSNGDARPGYWWPRYGERICVEETRTWALWKRALSVTEDTLRTFKSPVCQCFFSLPFES